MQFIFQFPLVDLRQLPGGPETVDAWPSSDMSKDEIVKRMNRKPFIRNFGKISGTTQGRFYCNINCLEYEIEEAPVYNDYKNLYSDSLFTKTTELGLLTYYDPSNINIADLLAQYMKVPIKVMNLHTGARWHDEITTDFRGIAPALAINYGVATRKFREQPDDPASVVNGEPCIVLTYESGARLMRPANAEKLDDFAIGAETVSLYGYKWNFDGQTYKVWLFELSSHNILGSSTGSAALRVRQENLFRMNAEKETIRILVNHLQPEHATPEVKKYLKKTPTKIFRRERFSSEQHTVRDFALQSDTNGIKFATVEDLEKLFDKYGLKNIQKMEEGMKAAPAKKSILFITSNPTDTNPIDFGEQFKMLSEALKSGTDRDYFVLLNIETGVEREKLIDILYTKKPDFLHITLHASEIRGLYFQDAAKKPDPMTAEEFADCVKSLNTLKKIPEAVILCACNSLTHAEAIKAYCKYAVGTNYVFPDTAAVVYARKFYNALFNGMAIDFCHHIAIHGIQYNKPPFDPIDDNEVYNIPQLISAT